MLHMYIRYTAAILEVWHEVVVSFDDTIHSAISKTTAGAGNIMDIWTSTFPK